MFFPETSAGERYWEIKISGDDNKRCRQLAEELARSTAAVPLVTERVLNFKKGSPKLDILPDRERLAESGVSFYRAADTVRRGVHGPVAYKRIGPQGETDVRLRIASLDFVRSPSRAETMALLVSPDRQGTTTAAQQIDSLSKIREGFEPSSIRREDRRRTASITIGTRAMDPRRVKQELAPLFAKMELPPGYSIEFDPDAIRRAESLERTVLFFLLALAFCYMVIASINESFTVPLAVLFAVPPSLAVPALFMFVTGRPFNPAAACAFVAVSGMTVNAAVLCTGSMERFFEISGAEKTLRLYCALRRNMPALFATTITTIAGALPFLFLREGVNALVKTLALVSVLGVGASCLCAISAVPALSILFEKILVHIRHGKEIPPVRIHNSN